MRVHTQYMYTTLKFRGVGYWNRNYYLLPSHKMHVFYMVGYT
uniref:Uncharacterized protein n=1 Tax=Anguilla anguilla TaxID=7936 RepID=A0A0E9TC74_ANGAN